ncbi:methyl-accepting chemotaxis protein [Mucisphaera calidilacus]|uniref:Methyl-accepting chemotaxis protein 4 n=1 Tax=Mucisphaera calidilacus TaxID=2527982 RepID=A0A518BVL0_9BACT|nr:methyl-accepting chemotaxis protein [Mucisphaera calidilacus]QDU71008.1 Methyl-accepting chemotaxis protein 4 [Mucisphaera calidilacus]
MFHLRLSTKVWSLVILVAAFGVLTSYLGVSALSECRDESVERLGHQLLEAHELRLETIVNSNAAVIGQAIADVPAAEQPDVIQAYIEKAWFKTTKDETKKQGYFFVYDMNGVGVAHASNSDLRGQDRLERADSNGVQYIREMVEKSKAGGGYVSYVWTRPGEEAPAPKLSYANMIPGTEYFLATGIYVDDVDEHKASIAADLDGVTNTFLTRGGIISGVYLVLIVIPFTLWIINRSIQKPLRHLAERFKDIAEGEGDLTQRVRYKNKDEIGEVSGYFDLFMDRLHKTISEVSSATEQVAASAGQIASSSRQVTDQAHDQTQQLTQISSAVEEMSSSVVEVAKKSSDANQNAEQAGDKAQEGGDIVRQTVTGINGIADMVRDAAVAVDALGERSEAIGEVIAVINDIADQTNLLALNAAIEAARAGEHGRGFAVVADEVRKLADRTTKATEEIAESIKTIQVETKSVVGRIEAGTEQVSEGVQLAERAGGSLEEIVTGSQQVAAMIQSIAAAAEQQSSAAEEISHSLDSISGTTRVSAESASQASEAAGDLASQADRLRSMIGQFKIS